MRIEIDQDLAKLLDAIKRDEPVIYGRGHVETVRFLANYYQGHKPLAELEHDIKRTIHDFLGNLDTNLEAALTRVILRAFARAMVGIFKAADEKQPVEDPRPAESSAPGGR